MYFSDARRYDLSGNITLLTDTQPEFLIGFEARGGTDSDIIHNLCFV